MTTKSLQTVFFVFLAILGITSSSCTFFGWGKYDDGPGFSVLPVKTRVINKWKWSYVVENGQNLSGDWADATLELDKEENVTWCFKSDSCIEGNWNLVSKNTKLQFIFGPNDDRAYDLKLVKNKEIWLDYTDTTNNIDIHWELVAVD